MNAAQPGDPAGWPAGPARIVDLSLVVSEDLPAWWPTHLPFQHKTWCWFADLQTPIGSATGQRGPYTTRWFLMDEHTGTHVDAPRHFLPPPGSGLPDEHPLGAVTAEQIPLEQLVGPARVMDVRDLLGSAAPGVSPEITLDRVRAWEEQSASLRAGDVLLLRSDWDARYVPGPAGSAYVHDVIVMKSAAGWPAPTPEMARYVAERGVRCLGTDAPSVGPAQDGRPVHVAGLGAGLVFLECLANLRSIPAMGAFFVFAPIKVKGGSGAPGRAFALVPESTPGGATPESSSR
jgi:kynurenine formamidase